MVLHVGDILYLDTLDQGGPSIKRERMDSVRWEVMYLKVTK